MSLIVSEDPPIYPDPNLVIFFDDFIGASYDNAVWSTQGTGSVASLDSSSGRLLVRSTSGGYQFYQGDAGTFSCAKGFTIIWRGRMIPSATGGGSAECGIEGAGDQGSNWIVWYYNPSTSANFQCQCGATSGNTFVDSGVIGDNNDHIFKIVGSSSGVNFFLDNVLRTTITTNITASQLQPYCWLVYGSGNSDINADYVLVFGSR